MTNYLDSHCHIISPTEQNSLILGRICNARDENDWEPLANSENDINFICLGIHPWFINNISKNWAEKLRTALLAHPKAMIGEVGLDKNYPNTEKQKAVFATQIQLAHELARPLHLHIVGAWEQALQIFKQNQHKMPPVVLAHSFNGAPDKIQFFSDKYNMYFSYSYRQISRLDNKTIQRILLTPIDKLLTESDTDTESNEIVKLDNVLNAIAQIKNMPIKDLSQQIYQNFQRVIKND
ncbi:MAG: TatD family hydrolase [Alphaproteobacteria bacterium]|nr:TatD family hydrolase [Alphaproteobacteria bacterium]